MRFYQVKPVDKVLPRAVAAAFSHAAIHVATRPAVFRAPMLGSQIHPHWEVGFCTSTTYQLQQTALRWSDLWLTLAEQEVVQHYEQHGEWLMPAQLREKEQAETNEES